MKTLTMLWLKATDAPKRWSNAFWHFCQFKLKDIKYGILAAWHFPKMEKRKEEIHKVVNKNPAYYVSVIMDCYDPYQYEMNGIRRLQYTITSDHELDILVKGMVKQIAKPYKVVFETRDANHFHASMAHPIACAAANQILKDMQIVMKDMSIYC